MSAIGLLHILLFFHHTMEVMILGLADLYTLLQDISLSSLKLIGLLNEKPKHPNRQQAKTRPHLMKWIQLYRIQIQTHPASSVVRSLHKYLKLLARPSRRLQPPGIKGGKRRSDPIPTPNAIPKPESQSASVRSPHRVRRRLP